MRGRTLVATAALTLLMLVGGACSSTYTAEELVDELVDELGVSREQSDCIVSGMEAEDVPLDKFSDSSQADQAKILDITRSCMLGGDDPGAMEPGDESDDDTSS